MSTPLARELPGEIAPPVGHIALVFTNIRNSTHLWETSTTMKDAIHVHDHALRQLLRLCGGYEVKTMGDTFMCSFPSILPASLWCLGAQVLLLHAPWPQAILECEEGKEVYDSHGTLVKRGLSVRMGVHSGTPICKTDPITGRMDYFGPMVSRAWRISRYAMGGQILCSEDARRQLEIEAQVSETEFETGSEAEDHGEFDMQFAGSVDIIRELPAKVIRFGEVKLGGTAIPESLSLVYPTALLGRRELIDTTAGQDIVSDADPV